MPKITNLARSIRNRWRKKPAHIRGGAIVPPGPPDPRNFKFEDIMAAAPPAAAGLPDHLLMPVGLQRFNDCGPWSFAVATFAATGWRVCPRFMYFWSRRKSFPNIPAAQLPDGGTTAPGNASIAAKIGQALLSVWPYEGGVNEVPSSAANLDASRRLLTYFYTPTLAEICGAVATDHAVICHVYTTTDFYYPVACADGSFEVIDPTVFSGKLFGHSVAIVRYDLTRKMLNGTVGGVLIQNSWDKTWGRGGYAWISISYWLSAKGGHAGSRLTFVTQLPPPAPTPTPTPIPSSPPVINSFGVQLPKNSVRLKIGQTAQLVFRITSKSRCEVFISDGDSRIFAEFLEPDAQGIINNSMPVSPKVNTRYELNAKSAGGTAKPKVAFVVVTA